MNNNNNNIDNNNIDNNKIDNDDIIILGIETSCDETSVGVVKNGREIMSNVISSQVIFHKQYGGVVPEIASRKHVELIIPVIDKALIEAGISKKQVEAIGVTFGPGLVGALLVGITAAKALAFSLNKPLVGVNHIEGHIAANYLENKNFEPPFICLVVSGGHSHLVIVEDYLNFKIIGRTRDDAAGETFDKIARVLGLGYPGGPLIEEMAKRGNKNAVYFPRARFNDGSFDFSFSGLKTAVINYVNTKTSKQTDNKAIDSLPLLMEDVAASFQQAVADILVNNTIEACEKYNIKKIALAGGVASNSFLRKEIESAAKEKLIKVNYPRPVLCTDNAAMIACAAYYKYINGVFSDLSLDAVPDLQLGEFKNAMLNKNQQYN